MSGKKKQPNRLKMSFGTTTQEFDIPFSLLSSFYKKKFYLEIRKNCIPGIITRGLAIQI